MCGRFVLYGPIKLRRELKQDDFDWLDTLVDLIGERAPRYNFAPTQVAPMVRATFARQGQAEGMFRYSESASRSTECG